MGSWDIPHHCTCAIKCAGRVVGGAGTLPGWDKVVRSLHGMRGRERVCDSGYTVVGHDHPFKTCFQDLCKIAHYL